MSSGKQNNIVGDWHLNGTQMTVSAATLNAAMKGPSAGKMVAAGQYTMQAADDTAGFTTIATGLTTIASAVVNVLDSGDRFIVTADADITWSNGNLVIADGAVYACTAGQKISWIAFGV